MEVVNDVRNQTEVTIPGGRTILQLRESSGFYGAENMVIELSKALSAGGCQVIVGILARDRGKIRVFERTAKDHGLSVRVFPVQNVIDMGALFGIRQLIRHRQVHIVHAHGYTSNFYALAGGMGTGVWRIATCHPWAESRYSARARFYEKLDLFWLRYFDAVVAVSREVREKILAHRISGDKVQLIANGIDITRFSGSIDREAARETLAIPPESLVVGTIGRLSVEKGHRYLIEAVKELREAFANLQVVLVGDGPLRGELEKLARQSGVENQVRFMGKVHNIPLMLALMDVFVLPSLSEGMPMALLEAMAARVPVVATPVGDIPVVIADGVSGRLVPPENPGALAQVLAELLADRRQGARLAGHAFQQVQQRFCAEKMAAHYRRLFEQFALKA